MKMAVLDLKAKITEKTNVPVGQQRIIFKGKVLHDDKDLSFYCIKTVISAFFKKNYFIFYFSIWVHTAVQDGHALHMVERPTQTGISLPLRSIFRLSLSLSKLL
jgi:hypothetical protein